MDKRPQPHVVRTWTVERTKLPFRQPVPARETRTARTFGKKQTSFRQEPKKG